MATRHSSVVGGSSAERVLNCPASVPTVAALPNIVETTNVYAEEGSHYHDVMSALMQARQSRNKIDLIRTATSYIGRHFYDRELTTQGLNTAVIPALQYLAELERIYGGGFRVVGVEKEMRFPGIPGAFGTGDVMLQSTRYIMLPDWKFGAGVPVAAVYQVDGGEILNPQLAFYLTAALATHPEFFADREIVGAIIQPRTDEPLTHTVVLLVELHDFAQDLERAIIAALGHNPLRQKGEWCRWAPCKLICPLWTGPLLDLSMLKPVKRMVNDATTKIPTPYGQYLATAKMLLDQMSILKTEIDVQIHAFLTDGGLVPGWKLKPKRVNRQWVDDTIVEPVLRELGFTEQEIFQRKLQTFANTDLTAKRRGVAIPDHLRVKPPSNETTVAAEDDPAPAVETAKAVANFGAALKKLTKSE